MTNRLEMHYPSTPSAYFAIGAWANPTKVRNAAFYENSDGVAYFGPKPLDGVLATFRGQLHLTELPVPSQNENVYWVQAPIAAACAPRLKNITCNSGKFLVFIPKTENRDESWEQFATAYKTGKLGYAIQCSTPKPSPHDAGTSNGVIMVYMEDSFDLEKIVTVAYALFETMYSIWPSFDEGVLQFMTDRSTRAKVKGGREGNILYSISSRSFLSNPCSGDKAPKSFQLFLSSILYKVTPKAQERQNMLKGKEFASKKRELTVPSEPGKAESDSDSDDDSSDTEFGMSRVDLVCARIICGRFASKARLQEVVQRHKNGTLTALTYNLGK